MEHAAPIIKKKCLLWTKTCHFQITQTLQLFFLLFLFSSLLPSSVLNSIDSNAFLEVSMLWFFVSFSSSSFCLCNNGKLEKNARLTHSYILMFHLIEDRIIQIPLLWIVSENVLTYIHKWTSLLRFEPTVL